MQRNCAICSKVFTKPKYCSLKEWQQRRKTCSIPCANVYKKRQVAWNKGKTEADDPRVAYMAQQTRKAFRSGRAQAWSKGITGKDHPLTGRKLSQEHRKKISKAHKGAKHWNWRGGITDAVHRLRNQMRYQGWRKAVLAKVGRQCQNCGATKNLHCHHVESFRETPELRYDVDNGTVLCWSCHQKEHRHVG